MSNRWLKLGKAALRNLISNAIKERGSMRAAAASIPMNFQTFRAYAKLYDMWVPNPGGEGTRKKSQARTSLSEILEGKHPTYSRANLKIRLLKEGIKKNECEECGVSQWRNKPLTIHLDHKNGNPWDHRLENLRMLCPNCHSQTPTYCGRNSC